MSALQTAAATFKTELQAMQNLLVQQRSILNAEQHAYLMTAQASSFASRAGKLRAIAVSDVGELTSLIQGGPWNSDQQSMIVMALATAMHTGTDDAPDEKRRCQELFHFQNYITADRSATFKDPTLSMIVKIQAAIEILDSMSAVLLKEICKRHVLAVVCALQPTTNGWRVRELRQWYLYFKQQYTLKFKGKMANTVIGHLHQFPERPAMLTAPKLAEMFKGVECEGVEINQSILLDITEAIKCRGNAVALRDDAIIGHVQAATTAPLQDVPPALAMCAGDPASTMMQSMMHMMSTFMQHNAGRQDTNPEIRLLPPRMTPIQNGAPARSNSSLNINQGLVPQQHSAMQRQSSVPGLHMQPSVPAGVDTPAAGASDGHGSVPAAEDARMADDAPANIPSHSTLSPEQQAKRFQQALNGSVGGDDDEEESEEELGGEGYPIIKAKPAANVKVTTAKAKAKGNAKGKGRGKAKGNAKGKGRGKKTDTGKTKVAKAGPAINHNAKAPVTGWPMAKRLKNYPDGCAKCRHSPGCTRSCFYYRGEL